MTRLWIFAAFLILVPAPLAAAQDHDLSAKGKALAEAHCARCHAVGPSGDSPHKDAPPFRALVTKWPLQNLEEALAEGIVTGHPDMPAFEMEPPNIDALIEYFATLLPPDGKK